MKCFLAISLCALAALALTSDAASTRTSEDAVTLATNNTKVSTSGTLEPEELSRTKRTLGVDESIKKEYEIKTRRGGSIKVSKSITYNDGGGLTMAPALIDSIGANRRKLIYALRGYKYRNCNMRGCDWEGSSAENNEPAGDGNFGGGAEISAPVQAGGQIGGLGGAGAEAAAEASGQAQIIGGAEGWGGTAGSGSHASAQASAQASSQAEGSAVTGSQVSAEASSEAEGNAVTGSQASASASSEAEGSAVAGSQASASASNGAEGSAVAGSQASAAASSQAQASGSVAGTGIQAPVATVQGGSWEIGPSHVIAGGSGVAWEGAHTVGGWPGGCAGDYIGSTGCICSQMMPVLMTPANSYGLFGRHHLLHNSPFSHVIKRHIRSRFRPLFHGQYPMNSLCASYNSCCAYRK